MPVNKDTLPGEVISNEELDASDWNSLSVFTLGALVLESRKVFIVYALVGAAICFAVASLAGPYYTATANFVLESGNDSDLPSIMGLAGQFGIQVGRGASSTPSPDLYTTLARSSVVLDAIGDERFPTTSASDSRLHMKSLAELLKVKDRDAVRRRERTIERLQELVGASYNRRTGVITLTVRTRWRTVSMAVAQRILERLNDFNLRTRQTRAKAERKFAEHTANEARGRLRSAEDQLTKFSIRNRIVRESPILILEYERMQREIAIRQQLLISIEQSLEKARLREVQDTPAITVLQPPIALSIPDPRKRIKYSIIGALLGLMLSAVVLPTQAMFRRRMREGDQDLARFLKAIGTARKDLLAVHPRRSSDRENAG